MLARTKLGRHLTSADLALQKFILSSCSRHPEDDEAYGEALISACIGYNSQANLSTLLHFVLNLELLVTPEESVLMRGVSVAAKMLSGAALHYGKSALIEILRDPLTKLVDAQRSGSAEAAMEVDPSRLSGGGCATTTTPPTTTTNATSAIPPTNSTLLRNRQNLLTFTHNLIARVFAYKNWPSFIVKECRVLAEAVEEKFPNSVMKALGGFLFLRFICPALVSPVAFGLLSEQPDRVVQRGLVLATKLIQGIANQAPFEKEEYMTPFNDFIESYATKLESFFDNLLRTPLSNEFPKKDIHDPEQHDYAVTLCDAVIRTLEKEPETASADPYFLCIGKDLEYFRKLLGHLRTSTSNTTTTTTTTTTTIPQNGLPFLFWGREESRRSFSSPESPEGIVTRMKRSRSADANSGKKMLKLYALSKTNGNGELEAEKRQDRPLDPRRWAVPDVLNWLSEVGLEDLTDIFSKNKIDGQRLHRFTDRKEAQNMGVQKLGDRIKLQRCVEELLNWVRMCRDDTKLLRWSENDVLWYLKARGMGHLVQEFEEGKVDGLLLSELTDTHLLCIGVMQEEDRRKLLRLVERLKRKNLPWHKKRLSKWTSDDVARWLVECIGLSEEIAQNFVENDVRGSLLPELQKEELTALGVVKLGHRKSFQREIAKLVTQPASSLLSQAEPHTL